MSAGFADHFSARAADYGAFRPHYPDALFARLAAETREQQLAWDVGTGSGQALAGLCAHYAQVLASDASLAQLGEARRRGHDGLVAARAERAPLPAASVDLVTVAQALHWFDLPPFFAEVQRVLKPGGVLAVWTYNLFAITPVVDAELGRFYTEEIGAWWPADRRHVENAYADIDLPWGGGARCTLEMQAAWSLAQVLAYVATWSAVTRYRQANGVDPMPVLAARLESAWGVAATRVVNWPLTLMLTRKPG
ncbi:MAG: methyltransferase domain-containing protein [Gammaproteobacteria bacterium]